MRKETLAIGLIASMTYLGVPVAAQGPGAERGPSSSQSPYLVRTTPGIVTTSILTTGDSVVGYRMAGIPDGLGAFDNGDGTFTVLMHHEIPASLGVVRAHGGRGAFISKWVVDSGTLQVLKGEDLIKQIFRFNGTVWTQIPAGNPALNIGRLCSADLPDVSAYYDAASGLGTIERIFMGGEEIGDEGRVFGTVVTGPEAGSAYQLSALGRFSWENVVAKPSASRFTVVAGLDDSGGGQVYFYVGAKKSAGTEVDKAGLTQGILFGLKIDGVLLETDATSLPGGSAHFSLVPLGDVSQLSGGDL